MLHFFNLIKALILIILPAVSFILEKAAFLVNISGLHQFPFSIVTMGLMSCPSKLQCCSGSLISLMFESTWYCLTVF